MDNNRHFSILFPDKDISDFKQLSDTACHDLGLDNICSELTDDNKERKFILNVISRMTSDLETAIYRQKVFADILSLPELRKTLLELFDKIEFMRSFGTMHKTSDEEMGLWHLFHRLDELNSYIQCVEAMRDCLSDERINSDGLKALKMHIDSLYDEAHFEEMKKDISELKIKASDVKSVTLGINVNDRFEAVSMGLISVNRKPFKKSGIVSSFADSIASKDNIRDTEEWNGDMHYRPIERENKGELLDFLDHEAGFMSLHMTPFTDAKTRSTIVNAAEKDGVKSSTFYLETTINKMLSSLVRKLRDTLTKYANVAIVNISQLVPEFIYYIRFAEFIEKQQQKGFIFCEPNIIEESSTSMEACGFYNLKLAVSCGDMNEIVTNDLTFDKEHTIYILTGANRGGKTTLTQAVGLLYVLAQGGIFVPASSFGYRPADCIYTHFPADEDKTMDLGRLGEECVRFREIYSECTESSLLLLNETFSTTSFEEGYFIARDSVRALMRKSVRTLYNTHMHKLAADADELNRSGEQACVSSLIMKSDEGKRSFKVAAAPPEGMSYARDIAEKYGVTYEMLTGE